MLSYVTLSAQRVPTLLRDDVYVVMIACPYTDKLVHNKSIVYSIRMDERYLYPACISSVTGIPECRHRLDADGSRRSIAP